MSRHVQSQLPEGMRLRIKIATLFSMLLLFLLLLRAYDLQIVQGSAHYDAAMRQTIASVVIEPARGDIFDRNGEALAISVDTQSLYIKPKVLGSKKEEVKRKLQKIFPEWQRTIERRFNSKSNFVWVLRRLPPEDVDKILVSDVLDYKGVGLLDEKARFYPFGEFAAPLLGFVNYDGVGVIGIEREFDDLLRGKRLKIKGLRDARRNVGLGISEFEPLKAKGASVVLTIDKAIQYITDKAVRKGVERAEARIGLAAVANPHTGEILALSQYPSFDANRYYAYSPKRLHNAAVEYVFEPGSTLKIVTIGAALDEGIVSPKDVFNCGHGVYRIGPNVIHDSHWYREEKLMTVEEILVKSSNIGTAQIAEKLGAERLYKALRLFGFGERTGIELPLEAKGLLRHWKKWYPIDLATISFGQGISATLLQVLQMIATVANDGVRMPLTIVQKVRTPEGETFELEDQRKPVKVLKPQTARLLRTIMEKVVGDEGTASKAAIEGITVAGKTGTAQKFDHKLGRYSKKKWTSWFVGMVPADNPQIVVAVMVDEPGGKYYYGGDVAAPIFREIVIGILRHYGKLATVFDETITKEER